jgi:hypothetical protein
LREMVGRSRIGLSLALPIDRAEAQPDQLSAFNEVLMKSCYPLLVALSIGAVPGVAGAQAPSTADAPTATEAPPAASGSLFDPSRHMHLSEVHPGMTGYGLSVFKGTKIEKFDVVVLSVLKNFNPKSDVVLIRCKGDLLEHTGSIAGMSGSPIFLKDDQGRYRMIGAFAYGWPLTKDPVAGVQPIEYMLKLPELHVPQIAGNGRSTTRPAGGGGAPLPADRRQGLSGGMSWSLTDAGLVPFWKPLPARRTAGDAGGLGASPRLGMTNEPPQLQPLATPLMTSGLSGELMKKVSPLFSAYGLTALQAGGGSADEPPAKLEPGSALAVPLLSGDVDMTAIGTVTEVLGDRVFGFGHPFNNEGAVQLPMGSGEIHGIIANLQTSFKLGSLTRERGELSTDESVGVAGQIGEVAPTVPIEFHVTYADGTPARTYHFQSAQHPKFTPMLAGVALSDAITGPSELPQYNTLDYDLKLEFANGQTIDIANTTVNASSQQLFSEIGLPLVAASENPFERVAIRKITGNIHISAEARQAQILEVNLPRSKYRAGETVKAFVTYKPFRGDEEILPVELELPHGLAQGTYQLIISDAQRYFQDTQQSEPFRFTADSAKDVFGVLKDVAAIRENAVYLRLLRQPDGVAVGRVALPQLPSSRRQIMLGAGRSNITPFVSSTVKIIPTDRVMSGSAEFAITIDPKAKVELGSAKAPKAEPAGFAVPAGKTKTVKADSGPGATTPDERKKKD